MKHKKRPATDKQRKYAAAIAKVLMRPLPKENSMKAYSEFISTYAPEYKWVMDQVRQVKDFDMR